MISRRGTYQYTIDGRGENALDYLRTSTVIIAHDFDMSVWRLTAFR